MKGTKKFFTFLFFPLFFIAVAFTSGCSDSIGGLEVDNPRNYIRAAPYKFLYPVDDYFMVKDVDVIGVFSGRERLININDNDVKIEITPPFSREPVPVDKEKGFQLTSKSKGVNTVVISYLDLVTDYPIQVVAPGEVPGYTGGGGTSIIINWPDKQH